MSSTTDESPQRCALPVSAAEMGAIARSVSDSVATRLPSDQHTQMNNLYRAASEVSSQSASSGAFLPRRGGYKVRIELCSRSERNQL